MEALWAERPEEKEEREEILEQKITMIQRKEEIGELLLQDGEAPMADLEEIMKTTVSRGKSKGRRKKRKARSRKVADHSISGCSDNLGSTPQNYASEFCTKDIEEFFKEVDRDEQPVKLDNYMSPPPTVE